MKDIGNISLRFTHPSRDLEFLETALDLSCFRRWKAGDQRTTPTGTPLAGTRKESYWVSRVPIEDGTGFASQLELLLNLIIGNAEIMDIARTGGEVALYLMLSGKHNTGDNISPDILKLMGSHDITLMIEVFPGG